jgi:hypothetical protein
VLGPRGAPQLLQQQQPQQQKQQQQQQQRKQQKQQLQAGEAATTSAACADAAGADAGACARARDDLARLRVACVTAGQPVATRVVPVALCSAGAAAAKAAAGASAWVPAWLEEEHVGHLIRALRARTHAEELLAPGEAEVLARAAAQGVALAALPQQQDECMDA